MIDQTFLRKRLDRILQATSNANATTGWWLGDRAGELQVQDNLKSGGAHWAQARTAAQNGLKALERGDTDYASRAARMADELLAVALAAQMKPANWRKLEEGAGLRGAPTRTTNLNLRLAEAVAKEERRGLKSKEARWKAIESDPMLKHAFGNKTDGWIRECRAAGEKLRKRK